MLGQSVLIRRGENNKLIKMAAIVLFVNLIIGIYLLAYFLHKKTFEYWKTRNVPYIQPELFYGNSRGLGTDYHTYLFMLKAYKELKDQGEPLGGVYISLRPTAIITDLDLVKSVLVKDFNYFPNRGIYYNAKDDPISEHISNIENEQWKNLRSKLTPTFSSGKLKVMFNTIQDISDNFMRTIERETIESGSLEIKEIMARFTCDVIGNVAFGVECDSLNDKSAKFYDMAVKSMDSFDFVQRLVLMGYRKLARTFRMKLTPDDVSQFYFDVVKSIVAHRVKDKETSNRADLMNILIGMLNDGVISMEQIAAQSFFYFVAGYETTSTTLTFCLYELAQNQELQQKARDEVADVMQRHNNGFTYEGVNEMSFVEKIIKETLRKWPPSVSVQREAVANYKVPNSKIVIEKGCPIMVPVYAIHHDESIYPEPAKFDPHRFDDDQVALRHPYSFLPFGEGPRVCPGVRFSLLETKVCLAKLLSNYQFALDYEQTEYPIKIAPSKFMMCPANGVYVKFNRI